MQRWLLGMVPFRQLVQQGHARVIGPGGLARDFPTWFDTTMFTEGLKRARRRRRAGEELRAAAS